MHIDTVSAIAFGLLLLDILLLWVPLPRSPAWPAALAPAVALAFMAGVLDWRAIVAMLVFAGVVAVERHTTRRWLRFLLLVLVALLALLLALHRVPGFHNPILFENVRFSAGAAPVTLYANFDTALAGLFLLCAFCERIRTAADWAAMWRRAWPVLLATLVVVLGFGWGAGYVRPDVKWTPYSALFLVSNLLVTCVTEEAFFRGFLLRRIAAGLEGKRYATAVAVGVSTLLFGLAHAAGGAALMLLATLAGAGYALAYVRAGRIEAAILTHFAVNAVHFVFFTYPASA